MRIAYVLTSLGIGGAERLTLDLADRMTRRGHTVVLVVLLPVVKEEWPTALRVVHLDMRKSPGCVIAALWKARRFLLEFRPNLVHSHSFHANMLARLLRLLVPAIRVVSTVHNVYEGRWHRMVAYRLTDSLAQRTTFVSQAAADRFVCLKAIHPRKCLVLPNGIDTNVFAPSPERRDSAREAMGAGSNFIWIAAGRLVPAKDIPNLLRAFGLVRAAFPDAHLWIAGAPVDVSLKQELDGRVTQNFASEGGSLEDVRMLGLRRDMPALFDAADAFVQSSAWEGMPLVVGEAMAMEKPVVATDAGGTRELVGDAGIVVPIRDATALAVGMIELMQRTSESRRALGRSARARITGSFSMDARANEWDGLYRSIVNSSS